MKCDSEECEREAVTVLLFEYPKHMRGVYCDGCADYLALISPQEVKSTNPLVTGLRVNPARGINVVTNDNA
jgi:hypothetical protein